MKKFLRVLLCFTILVTSTVVVTPSALAAGSISYNYDNYSSTLYINGSGEMANYGKDSNIAPWLSYYKSSMKNVVISAGVTSIGDYAFYGCTNLKSISLPDSVTSIGDYAFMSCTALQSITIPANVKTVGLSAFYGCKAVTVLNFNAKNCDVMASASYPPFVGCSSLATINVGADVIRIPDYSFVGLSALTTINLPESVASIGARAFYSCSKLETVNAGDKLWNIGDYAFYKCTSLKNFTAPRLLTTIGQKAFYGCTSLQNLTLSPNVTNIGFEAFEESTNLTVNVTRGSYAHDYSQVYAMKSTVTEPTVGGGTSTVVPTVATTSSVNRLNGKLVIYVKFDKPLTYECVHVAFYNSANKVVDYMIVPLANTTNEAYLVVNDVSSATYTKIFVWDSLKNCVPVSTAEVVDIVRP